LLIDPEGEPSQYIRGKGGGGRFRVRGRGKGWGGNFKSTLVGFGGKRRGWRIKRREKRGKEIRRLSPKRRRELAAAKKRVG